jgi:hypothetical protein
MGGYPDLFNHLFGGAPRMTPTESEAESLQKLERMADDQLARIAACPESPSPERLRSLEQVAAAAAKIAYGTGNPQLLSEQMRHLIKWTDHLDDASWTALFRRALMTRPLSSP